MIFNGFFHTGTRLFSQSEVSSIDLWKTDEQAEITLSTLQEDKKILLDEDESRIMRDWASSSMQTGIVGAQIDLLASRCALQEQYLDAAKLNRKISRRRTAAKRHPAQVAKAAQVETAAVETCLVRAV